MPAVVPFRRILWVKSVSMDEGELAYSGRPGQRFDLHSTPEDADSLQDPEVGDLVVLTQHDQVTHLVKIVGERVEERPRRSIKKGTRDERFTVQRTCEHVFVRPVAEAPFVDEAFGCAPDTTGGETLRIEDLAAVKASDQPMWMVQRRILNAVEGPSFSALFVKRSHHEDDGMPKMELSEFLRGHEV